jgi:hypothetical protein
MIECKLSTNNSLHSIIMNMPSFHSNTLKTLLTQNKTATLVQLQSALGTHAPATVFRKLAELEYLTSYSHGGRYYALKCTARFNAQGLWSFDSVQFSCHGSLLNTLEHFIHESEQGFLATELNALLHVDVKASLLKLFKLERVSREKYLGLYRYYSKDISVKQHPITLHEASSVAQGTRAIVMGSDWVSDEIKAAIILFFSLLDEKQRRLFAGLEAMQFGHGGDSKIAELLGIDPHTIAKGRRQLLERDIQWQGIRESGAGRPEVKKNT